MCLCEIDGQPFETRIANRDIVVWKALDKTSRGNYVSPYRDTEYKFGKLMKSELLITTESWFLDKRLSYIVEIALHSCLTDVGAREHSNTVFPAIIPAGSKFIIGYDNEVASNALIVYNDMKQLQAVHGRVRKPVQIKNAGEVVAIRGR